MAEANRRRSATMLATARELEEKAMPAEQRNRALVAFNEIATAMASTLELNQALARVLDATMEVTRADAGMAHLVEENTQQLSLVCHRGLSEDFVTEIGGLIGQGIALRDSMETRVPQVVDDTRAYASPTQPAILHHPLRDQALRGSATDHRPGESGETRPRVKW